MKQLTSNSATQSQTKNVKLSTTQSVRLPMTTNAGDYETLGLRKVAKVIKVTIILIIFHRIRLKLTHNYKSAVQYNDRTISKLNMFKLTFVSI